MEWIDVNDRLPENDTEVIVTAKYSDKEICVETAIMYYEGEWQYCTNDYYGCEYPCEVIAWMPLPKHYKRGDVNA